MFLEAEHDVTGNNQPIKGSDNRLNVSSRSDGRRYYNSRDLSQTYTLPFDDAACSAGDFNVALFNNRTDGKSMVISVVNVNALAVASFKIHEVTGTAAGGAVATVPYRENRAKTPNAATVTASTVANSDSSPISGLTSAFLVRHVSVVASGSKDVDFGDTWRLGQEQGIAVEMESGANATRVFGSIEFFFE